MLDAQGEMRELTSVCEDFGPAFFAKDGLGALRNIDVTNLPIAPQETRLSLCVAQTGNFTAIGLDCAQHALETTAPIPIDPVLFTSSVAVYGGDLPDVVTDGTPLNPRSSYGVQKTIDEFMLSDCTRKSFVDGQWRGCRRCASGQDIQTKPCASSIIRELLNDALRAVDGESAADRTRSQRPEAVERIVGSWSSGWDTSRATLDLTVGANYEAVVRAYVGDELHSKQ
jgi:hypothetical protein